LSTSEIRWFWRAADALGQPFGALFQLLLLTGMRLREAAHMTWAELDDDRTVVSLPGARTKNGRPHLVFLSPLARECLAGVRRIEGKPDYVFTTTGITPVSGFSKAKRDLDEAMLEIAVIENLKAAIEPWRLHDLRRTCATTMAEIGIAPHIVEACLNHISGHKGGVAGTYNRASYANAKRAAWERWAAHIETIVSGRPANIVPIRAA
jgi:integrase